MKPRIIPTITTDSLSTFKAKRDELLTFSRYLHIDIADGSLTPNSLVLPEVLSFPEQAVLHIHVMTDLPSKHLDSILRLQPDLIILHAEASDDLRSILTIVQSAGIRTGLALLPKTSVDAIEHLIDELDHVLVFGGHLGSQGGSADLSQLAKAQELHHLWPDIEIGWDGGVNETNIQAIYDAGVNVINVGSAISSADDPRAAYQALAALLPDLN